MASQKFWAALLAIGLGGGLLIFMVTSFGVGLVNDSVGYIGGARNIQAGNGYSRTVGDGTTRPVTNYPPLYPITLAGMGWLGIDAVTAARTLNALLYGANIILTGLLTRRASGSGLAGLGAAFFMGISEPFIRTHAVAMSEPLYLTLNLLFFLCLAQYSNGKAAWLVGAGVVASLGYLARYVGISLYAVALVSTWVAQTGWKGRLRDGGIFIAAGLPLAAAWTVRNYLVTGNTGNRLINYHPIPMDKWEEGVRNFAGWLLPESGGLVERLLPLWGMAEGVLLLAILAGAAWMTWRFWRKPAGNGRGGDFTLLLVLLQGVIYPTVLVMTLTFVDASPIFEHRILAPFYLCVIVLGATALNWMGSQVGRGWKIGAAVIVLGLALSLGKDSLNTVDELRRDGQGFASTAWRESETIQAVWRLPEKHIFSNKPTGIYILTGRPAYILMSPTNPATDLPRTGYQDGVAYIRGEVLERRAVMVVFDYQALSVDPESKNWIQDLTQGLPVVTRSADGVIFGVIP